MGQDNPLMLLAMLGLSVAVGKWWLDDYRAGMRGAPSDRALPGATPAPRRILIIAAAGSLLLLSLETAGEYALGVSSEQSQMTVLFALYTLAAAFVEELIFRGYVVIENKGRGALVGGIVGASLIFALLHPFLWEWKDGSLAFHFTPKAFFSTAAIFCGSLWFYAVRFMPSNSNAMVPVYSG